MQYVQFSSIYFKSVICSSLKCSAVQSSPVQCNQTVHCHPMWGNGGQLSNANASSTLLVFTWTTQNKDNTLKVEFSKISDSHLRVLI